MKLRLRWKKNPRRRGLQSVGAFPEGSTLRIDGVRAATTGTAQVHGRRHEFFWFWVCGWEYPELPHYNSSEHDERFEDEASARLAAEAHVRRVLEQS